MSRSLGSMSLTSAAVDQDRAAADLLEPGDHAQQRRLAAARRADQDQELAVGDVEADAVDDLVGPKLFSTSRNETDAIAFL